MSIPKIVIGGDSWACGEWPEGPSLHTTHKGLEDYFIQDGYTVINTARGGASNQDSISILSSASIEPNDIVIWVQTDPIRNLNFTELPSRVEQAGGIRVLMKQLLDEDYTSLNQIAIKYNCKIHVIGGLFSIQQDQLINYSQVNCLLESWVELLVGSQTEYACNDWSSYAILDSNWTIDHLKLNRFSDQKLAEQCINEVLQLEANRVVYQDPIFFPNGAHPNRKGHKILYNYIKERLKL